MIGINGKCRVNFARNSSLLSSSALRAKRSAAFRYQVCNYDLIARAGRKVQWRSLIIASRIDVGAFG